LSQTEISRQTNETFWKLYKALASANVGLQGTTDGVHELTESVLKSLRNAGEIGEFCSYNKPSSKYVQMEVSATMGQLASCPQIRSFHYAFDVKTLKREFIPVAEVLWA
jgi:hypothetical protein